jgi:hypothetical protein
MPPEAVAPGSVRSAAQLNEDIRTLARASWGRPMTDEERARYEVLVIAWVAAEQGDIVEAA